MESKKIEKAGYRQLVLQISETFVNGQQKAVFAVNSFLVETYWKIGQYIVEYEQGGSERAGYGKKLLELLSKDLSLLHGKGFSLSNLKRMRQFYIVFPISAEVPHQLNQKGAMASHKLSWSHYVELLKIEDPLGNRPHRIDLVFYHYILKCFVLIDLKREAAGYEDIGQMNMYLGYFEKEENNKGDNPPIGIVLAREKDEYVVEYTMYNISSRLFVSKYQLYLPTKEELKQIIERPVNNT